MRNVPPATTIWAHDASSTHAAFVVEQASRLRIVLRCSADRIDLQMLVGNGAVGLGELAGWTS